MLKFPATIKDSLKIVLASTIALGTTAHEAQASRNYTTLQHFNRTTANSENSDEPYSFRAVARMISRDGKTELSTREIKVVLTDGRRAILKGRDVEVTLEAVENQFRKTNMIKISAGVNRSSFNAGAFRLTAFREHSFLYTDSKNGWSLEVRLEPLNPLKALDPYLKQGKQKAPAKLMRKRHKRLPA
jgi:hypothetical protein